MMKMTTTMAVPVIVKRELTQILNAAMNSQSFTTMPAEDQQFLKELLTAAESNTVTQFIHNEGYSRVLKIMEGNIIDDRTIRIKISSYFSKVRFWNFSIRVVSD